MSNNPKKQPPKRAEATLPPSEGKKSEQSAKVSLATIAQIGAGALTLGSLLLFLMGHIAHDRHLASWGLDVGLFPMSYQETLILGYYSAMERTATTINIAASSTGTWLGFLGAISFSAFLFLVLPAGGGSPWLKRMSMHLPRWVRVLAVSVLGTAVFSAAAFVALCMVVVALVIPAAMAERFGQTLAANERATF